MGGYGTYLGFRILYSDNVEEKANAKDPHPKLLAGMFFFFALGETGGVIALLTSDKPILEIPHAVTGLIGLSLLAIKTILPTLFEGSAFKGVVQTDGAINSAFSYTNQKFTGPMLSLATIMTSGHMELTYISPTMDAGSTHG